VNSVGSGYGLVTSSYERSDETSGYGATGLVH
jgi:hypothetical protein